VSFTELDAAEQIIGQRVEQVTPLGLVSYLKEAMHQVLDIDLRVDGAGHRERAVMTQLQKVYGQKGAGQILKWVIFRYEGRHDGKPIGFFSFQKERKWWTDQLYSEVQDYVNTDRAQVKTEQEAMRGFVSLSEFLHG